MCSCAHFGSFRAAYCAKSSGSTVDKSQLDGWGCSFRRQLSSCRAGRRSSVFSRRCRSKSRSGLASGVIAALQQAGVLEVLRRHCAETKGAAVLSRRAVSKMGHRCGSGSLLDRRRAIRVAGRADSPVVRRRSRLAEDDEDSSRSARWRRQTCGGDEPGTGGAERSGRSWRDLDLNRGGTYW